MLVYRMIEWAQNCENLWAKKFDFELFRLYLDFTFPDSEVETVDWSACRAIANQNLLLIKQNIDLMQMLINSAKIIKSQQIYWSKFYCSYNLYRLNIRLSPKLLNFFVGNTISDIPFRISRETHTFKKRYVITKIMCVRCT